MALETIFHFIDNGCGWRLSLKQRWDAETLVEGRRPLMIVPGYGMNSFIFGWHPNDLSMEEYLVRAGFEVWSVDLRGQGRARSEGGGRCYHLRDIAVDDLNAAIAGVLELSRTGADKVDLIGCSLGGTYLYIHTVLVPDTPVGAMVGMGAPLRWESVHPALAIAFKSPKLASLLPFKGTRQLARAALPLLLRAPKILEIYMHADIVDTSNIGQLTQTVDDPNRFLNEDIAWWVNRRDILIDGVNISEALRNVTLPFLCLYANADGIVPPEAALSAYDRIGTPVELKQTHEVGDERLRFAHADMFVSDPAPNMVFEPLAHWLKGLYEEKA